MKAPDACGAFTYRLLVGRVDYTRDTGRMLPRSRAVRIGVALFVVGLVFIAADVVPFFFSDHNRPLWLNLACLLAPAGFAVAVWSAVRAGRADQRAAVRELAVQQAPTRTRGMAD
ncbi:MAG: hypothetical protein JWO57_260 [Pseudonocardiales bacterium]|nr:hypothetical protein [Pseudonocardiales bacterium]